LLACAKKRTFLFFRVQLWHYNFFLARRVIY